MRRSGKWLLGFGLLVLAAGEAVAKDAGPRPLALDWIGFRPREAGTSELFMLVTQPVKPREQVVGDRIYLMLDGVVPAKRNNTRSLDTRWFETPVAAITVKKIGKKGCTACLGKKVAGPSMPGAGLLITIIMKPKLAPSYTIGSEQSEMGPVPPHELRPGEKPKAPVTRTLIRVGFERPPIEAGAATDDTVRPRLSEPDVEPIKIPPAPKSK